MIECVKSKWYVLFFLVHDSWSPPLFLLFDGFGVQIPTNLAWRVVQIEPAEEALLHQNDKRWHFGLQQFRVSGSYTLPETNIVTENRPHPKRKQSYSHHPFSGALFVLGSIYWYVNLHGEKDGRNFGTPTFLASFEAVGRLNKDTVCFLEMCGQPMRFV